MEKIVKNLDGSESVVEVVTNLDGTQTESVVSTNKVVSTTPITSASVIEKTPRFVAKDKTQKFYQFTNANGKVVRTMYVNPTQTVEYFPNRLVTNLIVTNKSPLVSLVDVTSVTDKMGKSIATITFDSSILASSTVYYSTAPFKITLGLPNPVIVPGDALKVEGNISSLNHAVEIYDLNAGTMYSFAIILTDAAGNQNVTLTDHFVTQKLMNY